MYSFLKRLFGENLLLKGISLILAIGLWFYIVNELGKGSEEETIALQRILPSYGMLTKKLVIKPIIVGKPKQGFRIVEDKIAVLPEFCIVLGPRKVLRNLRFIYTMPVDIAGGDAMVAKQVPLKPLAPGVYVEEILVTVNIPIEKKIQ